MPRKKKEETVIEETVKAAEEINEELPAIEETPVIEEPVIEEKECSCKKKPCTLSIALACIIVILIGVIAYQNLMPHTYDLKEMYALENEQSLKLPNAYYMDANGNILKKEGNTINNIGYVAYEAYGEEEFESMIAMYIEYGYPFETVDINGINAYKYSESDGENTINYYMFYCNSSVATVILQNLDESMEQSILSQFN